MQSVIGAVAKFPNTRGEGIMAYESSSYSYLRTVVIYTPVGEWNHESPCCVII